MRRTPPKHKRIPRRGPGVAELEKILKEQEGQDISSPPPPPPPPPSSPSAFVFRQHHLSPSISSLNPPLPPPPPPPPPLSFLPPYDYSSWPHLPSFPSLDAIPPAMPTAADAAEKALFPIRTRISDSQMNFPSHFIPSFQFSASTLNLECYNSPVNFIPGSSSSCPAATSSAARNFHPIEHPSSQRSVDFNNVWTSPEEQEKMLSGKRLRPLMDKRHRDFDNRRIPIFSNMALKDSSSSSSSSLEMNRTALNLDSNLRGTKRGLNSGSFKLAEESNLMGLGSSSTPNEFPPFDFRQPQETMEALQHRDEGGSVSDYNKITFNSSLYESNSKSKSKGSIVASIGPEAKPEPEPEGEGIDLDLKL